MGHFPTPRPVRVELWVFRFPFAIVERRGSAGPGPPKRGDSGEEPRVTNKLAPNSPLEVGIGMPAHRASSFITTKLGQQLVDSVDCTDDNRRANGLRYARTSKISVDPYTQAQDGVEIRCKAHGTPVLVKTPTRHHVTPSPYDVRLSVKALAPWQISVANQVFASLSADQLHDLRQGCSKQVTQVL